MTKADFRVGLSKKCVWSEVRQCGQSDVHLDAVFLEYHLYAFDAADV